MWEVIETAKAVAEESIHVRINREAVIRFSAKLIEHEIKVPPWDFRHHFFDGSDDSVTWLLLLDTLNFCFWPAQGERRWEIAYGPERLSGYNALAVSLKQAMESGAPITEAEYLTKLSLNELNGILDGWGDLQLMGDMVGAVNELGRVLLDDYNGSTCALVESCNNSALKLTRLLAEKLASFRDISQYKDRKVCFYKRAQIFVADLIGSFQGRSWGNFADADALTAFADYKLPQVLRHLNILHYAQDMALRVDQKFLLDPGSPEEVEIRANTVWAIDLIRRELEEMNRTINPITILRLEAPTSFSDVKGKPDDFSFGSTLSYQARFGYRTA